MNMHDPAALFAPYNRDRCQVCGECLTHCPVMRFDAKSARRAVETMRAGKHVRRLDLRCQMCLACNVACPNGANPAGLIFARFAETMAQAGPRKWGAYFQQQQQVNFRTDAAAVLPAEDQALLAAWRDETPAEEITYPGCNVCNTAWLTRTRLLAGRDLRGGFHVCCGEPFFRTGMEDELRQCAGRLNGWLGRLGARRVTMLCTAGACMFRYVLPRYGLTHEMEVRPFLEMLHADFKAGRHVVTAPLGLTVTVQESCYGKVLGEDYRRKVRELLEMAGCRVVEMKHHGDCSLCCGIGAGFAPAVGYHPAFMVHGAMRVWREAAATKADLLVTYCAGCLLTLSAMGAFYPGRLPASHLLTLLARAIGEQPADPLDRVSRAMLWGAIRRQFPRLVDFRRAKLGPFAD
jgi:Fe-S oxidoreductase